MNVYIHLQYNKVIHFTCIFPGYSQAAEHLQSFIADCDRRTELAKKRLAETQDEISAEVAAKVKTKEKNTIFHLKKIIFRLLISLEKGNKFLLFIHKSCFSLKGDGLSLPSVVTRPNVFTS